MSGLYQLCLHEATTNGRSLMQALVRQARAAMESGGKPMAASLVQLDRHRNMLIDGFSGQLLAAFTAALATQPATPASPQAGTQEPFGKTGSFKFAELELMDEDQVQEQVEVARALQAARNLLAHVQPELDALVSSMLELASVQPERNPLRAETYVRALHATITQTDMPPAIRMPWLVHMGAALGRELQPIEAALIARLRAQGLQPADFAVRSVGSQEAPMRSPGQGAGDAVPATGLGGVASGERVMLTMAQLRRLLAADGEVPADATARPDGAQGAFEDSAAPPDFDYTVPAAFEALLDIGQTDLAVQRMRAHARDASAGGGQARAGANQAHAQEVVRLMLEAIARDPRLPQPVRDAIVSLEPALLALARHEVRFFSDKTHPARQLLDEIAQRGVAFESAGTEAFRHFMDPVAQACELLAHARIDGPGPFSHALQTLRAFWDEDQRERQLRQEQAVAALLHVEQRNMLAEKVAHEVRRLIGEQPLDPAVKRFLFGPWSQVIAQARLAGSGSRRAADDTLLVARQLAWTARPEQAARNKTRLRDLIPHLLVRLRDGLRTIDYPVDQINAFYRQLMPLHRQAFQMTAAQAAAAATARVTDEADESAGTWVGSREAGVSGFQEPAPSSSETVALTLPQATHEVPAIEDDLPVGSWIDMRAGHQWSRMQLVWASPYRTLFMFSASDGQPVSMTRRALQQLRHEGGVRLVSGGDIVDAALDEVARQALRNSVDLRV